jgi:Ni2+-binding GTPase involved in maturation of urease and hydrogenase
VLNKIDIAEAVHVDVSDQIADLQQLRPGLPVAKTDCLAGEGIDDVLRALNLTPA